MTATKKYKNLPFGKPNESIIKTKSVAESKESIDLKNLNLFVSVS
jgi:hypothetical protein